MAIPDFVAAILAVNPAASWTAAKKQKVLDLYCQTRGYQETIPDPENPGQTIPNPISKKQFVNWDTAKNWFQPLIEGESARQAKAEVSGEPFDFITE